MMFKTVKTKIRLSAGEKRKDLKRILENNLKKGKTDINQANIEGKKGLNGLRQNKRTN